MFDYIYVIFYIIVQLTYRGVVITDEINNLFAKNSTNSGRYCIAFIRYLRGDRNTRFRRVRYERVDARPEDMNDDDQTTDGVRGREKVMNMKDPEGVALFKGTAGFFLLFSSFV